ncbi:DJ-1/PfpI family protein [Teichococcus aestuarii]|uniref:DJ-1/PfpI family protein n=1 Tax=Teichococcus aestuarii TaxID=568898 RepID=UPI00361FD992
MALRAAAARGARLLSLCSGAFVLAAAGLLEGRSATTHWHHAAALAARHPGLRVVPDVLYVDEGMVLTAAGSAAGLDLCLHRCGGTGARPWPTAWRGAWSCRRTGRAGRRSMWSGPCHGSAPAATASARCWTRCAPAWPSRGTSAGSPPPRR